MLIFNFLFLISWCLKIFAITNSKKFFDVGLLLNYMEFTQILSKGKKEIYDKIR